MRVGQTSAICRLAASLVGVLLAAGTVNGERLPIKTYTSADGLSHNTVHRIVRDSRGFLWFCTREGLSRFDGYTFNNYSTEQGLPSAIVNDLLETRAGDYWVATSDGLCHFNPLGKPQASAKSTSPRESSSNRMFAVYYPAEDARSRHIISLSQDGAGVIWCGTRNGLYRLEAEGDDVKFIVVDLGIPDSQESKTILCLLAGRLGALWIGAASGLYRRLADGRVEAYTVRNGLPDININSLLEDQTGRIWVGTKFGGLCRLVPEPTPVSKAVARVYSDKDGLSAHWINQLFQASDGGLWAGSNLGLIQFIPTGDGSDFRFRAHAEAHGFSYHEIAALAEDDNRNLWVGMLNGGVAKIARGGFTRLDKDDGFFWSTAIFENRAGDLFVVGAPIGNIAFINRFDGETFRPIRPRFSNRTKGFTWGWNQTVLEDHTGEWWMATLGVSRFPKVSKPEDLAVTSAKAIYTTRDGLAGNMILRLFEDAHGDIWIGSLTQGKGPNGLSRWERRTETFHHYTQEKNLPRLDTFYVSSFAEDRAGNLWIGFSGEGGLARYRNGQFTLFNSNDGVPAGRIGNLFIDSAGRLWIPGYRGGLSRIDDPAAEVPELITYTTANGLASNEITAVTDDQIGRIYIGTAQGIDRLDLATSRIKHYTTADGLPLGEMQAAWRDREGSLWFSFATGLARLVPEPDPRPVPPPILITGVRIGGEAQLISALGQREIGPVKLESNKNQIDIDFVALGFSSGEGLRYQFKLEGASPEWSELSQQRTVSFANLAAGNYQFLVRAVNAEGVLSERPASLSFAILPPIWQRWWFMSMAGALLGLVAYALYRYRVTRLLELERVRTRIAADLHDDIGSNLSQIAIWGEVARRQQSSRDAAQASFELGDASPEPLDRIAATARETAAAMSDIVWAINPQRDYLSDLISRMRRFAGDAFDTRDIIWQFQAPRMDLSLGTDTRREIYLIFKESVNNIVSHARCTEVDISLSIEDHRLRLQVRDDGCGFDPNREAEGNGLESLRERARHLRGEVRIESTPGSGTMVELEIPINKPRRWIN